MRGRSEPTPLASILAEQIRARGPFPFAEYMDACLYHPEHGYYAGAHNGPRRDYVTSVDVSQIFGRLLARQFREMWERLDRPGSFLLVEVGAGSGELAKQILDFAAESIPDFYSALRYVAVERSRERRVAGARHLESHAARGRARVAAGLPDEIPCGCVFSNELLDAMPVHRVVSEAGGLREIYVGLGEVGFCEQTRALSSRELAEYFTRQEILLHEGQQAEANLEACRWIEDVGRKLGRGFVLTIDYGHEARELYNERHMRGTLLAYERHRSSENYFRAPGWQDLTAHVNFTALDLWGHRGGLVRAGFTSQTNFLLALARDSGFADLEAKGGNENDRISSRLLFKNLIHPEGMGETFRVFVQRKGIESARLAGFEPL